MRTHSYFVYILTNPTNTVLYTGITNDLMRRSFEHRMKLLPGFAAKYNCQKIVYFSETGDVTAAIAREKQIKGWTRRKKICLIEQENPYWFDLMYLRGSVGPSLRSG